MADTRRNSSSPIPGAPCAKVEYKRRMSEAYGNGLLRRQVQKDAAGHPFGYEPRAERSREESPRRFWPLGAFAARPKKSLSAPRVIGPGAVLGDIVRLICTLQRVGQLIKQNYQPPIQQEPSVAKYPWFSTECLVRRNNYRLRSRVTRAGTFPIERPSAERPASVSALAAAKQMSDAMMRIDSRIQGNALTRRCAKQHAPRSQAFHRSKRLRGCALHRASRRTGIIGLHACRRAHRTHCFLAGKLAFIAGRCSPTRCNSRRASFISLSLRYLWCRGRGAWRPQAYGEDGRIRLI